ncbi:MAG: PHP domain-containing protein [Bacillota bacterium]
MSKVDLHIHSTASDGSFTPEEIVEMAADAGLTTIAVTDHDSVLGVAPAMASAQKHHMEVLPAIELTAAYDGMLVDILGYLLDIEAPWFRAFLEEIHNKRMERAEAMVAKLRRAGYRISWEQVCEISRGGFVCGVNILHALYNNGHLTQENEIWERLREFFGRDGVAYVPNNLEFKSGPETIRIIHDLGGVAVIAHPGRYYREPNIRELVKRYGMDGVEAYYSSYTPDQTLHYEKMAKELGVIVTGGSDFHGFYSKGDINLGILPVPSDIVSGLKECRQRCRS